MKNITESYHCPHCNANLRGDPIPEEIAHTYPGTHWLRKIGIYDINLDRTVEWEYPDCGGRWKREY